MNLRFTLTKPDTSELKKNILEKQKQLLWLCMNKMEELAKRYAPVDIGTFSQRIRIIPDYPGAEEYYLVDGVEYGIHVEYGTRAHWVPIAPLKGWARRNLKDEDLAYAVQRKIAKYGTNAQPTFRPAHMEVDRIWKYEFANRIYAAT